MPRWGKWLIGLVVGIAVLAVIAEFALRAIIPNVLGNALRDGLNLPKNHPVEVTMGGLAVGYAITGDMGDIDVQIPDAPVVEGVEASLSFHADRAPFDVTKGEIQGGTASAFVTTKQLTPLITLFTNGVADSGGLKDGDLAVGRTIDAFGFTVPLEATLQLGIEDGEVRIDPTGLSAVGFSFDADQLAAATGGLLKPLLESRLVCVSDRIPQGITLTAIDVMRTGVQVEADLDPQLLSNPQQLELGSCE